jgi:hypothetical protein
MHRDLARVARRGADQLSSIIAAVKVAVAPRIGTVTTATAGGSADGTAFLVKVTWRGTEVTAAGYAASYTPALNHRVLFVFVDNQPVVLCRIVGQP